VLKNLDALRQIGFAANRRLLDVQTLSHDCTIGEQRFTSQVRPSIQQGQRASALPFGDPRILAMMVHALCMFALLPNGFLNREVREHVSQLLGLAPDYYTPGKMTYDLRRLRLHGLIKRMPRTNRYRVTDDGVRASLFFTRAHARFFRAAFAVSLCPDTKHQLQQYRPNEERTRPLTSSLRRSDLLLENLTHLH